MRKILAHAFAASAALALAFALAGCGGNANTDQSGESTPAEENASQAEDAAPVVEQRFADTDIMPEYLLGYYSLQAGDAAPDFTAEIVDANGFTGESLSLADLSGKVAVIDFWATWCPYCVTDMPAWQQLAEEFPDVVFLMVDIGGETFGEMKAFIAEKGYDFTFAVINEDMANAYPFTGVPYDVIIGRDGIITFTAEGSYGRYAYHVMSAQLEQASR